MYVKLWQRKEHVRRKICIENTIFEQLNDLNYLRYNLTYTGKFGIENKLEKFNGALR
jgi:hypothetical protein